MMKNINKGLIMKYNINENVALCVKGTPCIEIWGVIKEIRLNGSGEEVYLIKLNNFNSSSVGWFVGSDLISIDREMN